MIISNWVEKKLEEHDRKREEARNVRTRKKLSNKRHEEVLDEYKAAFKEGFVEGFEQGRAYERERITADVSGEDFDEPPPVDEE